MTINFFVLSLKCKQKDIKMKTTKEIARKTLAINGELLTAILNGGKIIWSDFNGWDWTILVKFPEPNKNGFAYGQFETMDGIDSEFYQAVERSGTPKQVLTKVMDDFCDTRRLKNKAFELGNIQ